MSNELVLSKDITVITAEINSYKQVAGQAIFEIGRRLKHVKENDLVHGEFGKWLESVSMSSSQANRFMKVINELDENFLTTRNIGIEALYYISTMPEDERTKPHTIPSTGESKTVDEMTVRELREVKKQLKESEELQKLAEDENEKLIKQLQIEKNKPIQIQTKVETKVVEKVVFGLADEQVLDIMSLSSTLNRNRGCPRF